MLTVYSEWPFFVSMALLLGFASLPLFRSADAPPSLVAGRVRTLDGLRGFLALGVFFQHAALYHAYMASGVWELPPSRLYALVGEVCVAVFFMITGYLFWGKMLQERGRPRFTALYIGRIFRIGPLYLVMVVIVFAIALAHTGLHQNDPVPELARQVFRWSALGVFGTGPDINGYADTGIITAGVTWTLRLEWMFYASLLLTAFVARLPRWHVVLPVVGLVLGLGYTAWRAVPAVVAPTPLCAALFSIGMLCAAMEKNVRVPRLPPWVSSSLVAILSVAAFVVSPTANAVAPVILLGLAFFLVVFGSNVFGLLAGRAARRLGDISYGIYLLQGLVLYLVFTVPGARSFALGSPLQHWLMVFLCAVLLVTAAAITHVWVERPGIDAGRAIVKRLVTRQTGDGPGRGLGDDGLPRLRARGSDEVTGQEQPEWRLIEMGEREADERNSHEVYEGRHGVGVFQPSEPGAEPGEDIQGLPVHQVHRI